MVLERQMKSLATTEKDGVEQFIIAFESPQKAESLWMNGRFTVVVEYNYTVYAVCTYWKWNSILDICAQRHRHWEELRDELTACRKEQEKVKAGTISMSMVATCCAYECYTFLHPILVEQLL